MAAQIGALRVSIGADITGLQTGMARAQRKVQRGAAGMQKSVNTVARSFKSLAAVAGVSLGLAGLAAGARAFLNIADASKQLQSQLKLATAEFGSLAQANKDVRAISERTRSDLLATSELYAALQRNSGQLGTTQQEVARATETVAKAFKVSGAATSEQSAATRQLIQAFQSGVLRGDEFNSIMENAPRLARLLADSLGITVGQLRAMAQEGKLTADQLVRAFTDVKFTKGLDEEFSKLPVTFDEAMGQIHNAAVVTFGAFDRGGQFSTMIAQFALGGAQDLAHLEERAEIMGGNFRSTIEALYTVFDPVGDNAINVIGIIESQLTQLRMLIGGTLRDLQNLANIGIGAANNTANLANAPGNLIRLGIGQSPIIDPIQKKTWADDFQKNLRKGDVEAARRRIMGRTADDLFSEFGIAPKAPPPFHPSAAGSRRKATRGKAAPRDRSDQVEAQFEAELRQANIDILRAKQGLLHSSEERAALDIQILELERQNENVAIDEKVAQAKKQLAEKQITEAAYKKVVADAEILKAKNDEAARLKTQAVLDEVTQQRAEDRARLEQSGLENQQDLLRAQLGLATTSSQRLDIELRLIDLSYRQEKARLEAVIADETSSDAAKKEAAARLKILDALKAADSQAARNNNRSPLQDFKAQWSDIGVENEQALVTALNDMADALSRITDGWKEMKKAALDTLKSLFQTLLSNQIKQLFASLIPGPGQNFNIGNIFGGGTRLPGFASGGSGVFGGLPGIDRNVLSLNGIPIARVSYGERFVIGNDNSPMRGAGGRGDTYITVITPDANSFRRSDRQIAREWNRKMGTR